jgi:hypothetical protein
VLDNQMLKGDLKDERRKSRDENKTLPVKTK